MHTRLYLSSKILENEIFSNIIRV